MEYVKKLYLDDNQFTSLDVCENAVENESSEKQPKKLIGLTNLSLSNNSLQVLTTSLLINKI